MLGGYCGHVDEQVFGFDGVRGEPDQDSRMIVEDGIQRERPEEASKQDREEA